MRVGDDEDGAILRLINAADRDLYVLKERSIYRTFSADEIDPQRTNETIPHGSRRIATARASSKNVCRTFLTANALMKLDTFDASIDRKPLKDLALAVIREMSAFV
ncbi:MAG: hypothetical protein ACI82I_000958 [Gammaproteobacteria bacterium]|jgi:hypothetical protein